MSVALVDLIAEAVHTQLRTTNFSLSFVPERLEVPDYSLTEGDLDKLKVSVFDADINLTRSSRTTHYHYVDIDVGIVAKVDGDEYKPRQLKYLVQEIMDHFRNLAESTLGYAVFNVAYLAHRVPEKLKENRVFMGVVRLTYRVNR